MSASWPRVPLGELLHEQRERVATHDANGLPLLGVSNLAGLHRSDKERIADMSRYFHVRKDWFAYNPMRINVGSIGWAESDEQTGVISPDYVVFSCGERVLPGLVYLYLRSRIGLDAINLETAGSVRERLYFSSLARVRIPLPPVAEQRRIVARVEAIAARVEEARRLRDEATIEADRLPTEVAKCLIDDASWERMVLRDCLLEDTRNGIGTKPNDSPPGVRILRISAGTSRADCYVDLADHKYLAVHREEVAEYGLRPGDLLACRFNGNLVTVHAPAGTSDGGVVPVLAA